LRLEDEFPRAFKRASRAIAARGTQKWAVWPFLLYGGPEVNLRRPYMLQKLDGSLSLLLAGARTTRMATFQITQRAIASQPPASRKAQQRNHLQLPWQVLEASAQGRCQPSSHRDQAAHAR